MNRFSNVALAAALAVGIGGIALVAPANAGKDKPAGDPGFSLSADVRASALAAQTALAANDLAGAASAIAAIESRAQNDDERYVATTLRVKLLAASSPTSQTMTALIEPLDKLIADSRTPKADLARYYYMRGDLAYATKRFDKAQQYYLGARDAGLQDDELNYQIVRSTMESGDVSRGAAALRTIIAAQVAAGKKAPENWYRYAMLRLYKADKRAEAVNWSTAWLAAYDTRPNWRDAIHNYGFQGGGLKSLTDNDRIDLYRLMSATRSLAGQSDYYDYAAAAIQVGLPNEGKAVIEEGRTENAIPATDKPAADLLAKAKAGIAAGKTFAVREKAAAAAAKGDVAAQTGDAYLGARNWAKAVAMYDLALTKDGVDATAVHLHRGIAYARSGDKDKARADLTAITTAPQSEIARFWLAWLDVPPAS